MTVPQRVVERIKARLVVQDNGCWLWRGATVKGYGLIGWHEDGKPRRSLVHRAIYEACVGPIPVGLEIDHTCHNPSVCQPIVATDCQHRPCCNPSHLEPVTTRTNVLRGGSWAPENAAKTECPEGHPYDEANTYLAPNGWRQCRICRRNQQRTLRARRKAA